MAALRHDVTISSWDRPARKKVTGRRAGPALLQHKSVCSMARRRDWTWGVRSALSPAGENLPSTVTYVNELERSPENKILGTVVIAGGGPAGCLMAHNLRRRGFIVQVFEKREAAKLGESHEQIYSRNDLRSYPMLLTTRGLKPLEDAHIKLPSSLALQSLGGTLHYIGGKKVKFDSSKGSDTESYAVSRNALVAYLQNELNQRYDDGVSMQFGWQLVKISERDNIATFKRVVNDKKTDKEAAQLEVPYDLLVGADGANSVVRKELLRMGNHRTNSEEKITEEIIENPNWYKSFHVSREFSARSPLYEDHNRTQRWFPLNLLLVGMADGSFWGGCASPKLVTETNPEVIKSILSEQAPGVLDLVLDEDPNWCEKFAAQPSINMGKAVILSHFHRGNIILIGDAAHSMYPTYGTGCNSALEDCALLDKILQDLLNTGTERNALKLLGAEFTKHRIRDAHTIVKLNLGEELFTTTKLDFLQRDFFMTLHRLFPAVLPRPASAASLSTTRSFFSIKEQRRRENFIFYSLLTLLALAIGLTFYNLARNLRSNLIRNTS